jgi:Peptidase M66/ToxR activated gene A lipoprotein domain
MTKSLLSIIGLMTASLSFGLSSVTAQAATPLVFNTTKPVNDLKGTLEAQVLFAQSQIIAAHPRQGDVQPHLVSQRKTLLLVRPLQGDDSTPMSVVVRNEQGNTLGSIELQPPKLLPKTAYYVEGVPEGTIDFTPRGGSSGSIKDQRDLEKLADKDGSFLNTQLKRHDFVEIETADGRWVSDIYVPQNKKLEGKIIRVRSQAGYQSTIHYSGRKAELSRGETAELKQVGGQWFQAVDLENNHITYATDTWSGVLQAEWIMPGISLQVRQGELTGELAGVKVGAPTQLLIHTIDIGMLTAPRGEFEFATNHDAQREYFQTVPTTRLIVSQYAPLMLKEVMLPDGTLIPDADPSEGGWHTGTMRQNIGKELISHGIDNANYGINSSSGEGEQGHPYVAAQLAAHNSRGRYSNGLQVHGGSGGGGIVTLDQSIGNELSHEVGHNYGLGHYVDGFKGSVHRSADHNNSTWGWDADRNRFIPNFAPTRSDKDTCLEGECQPPFDGRSFGLDAMAGGKPLSDLIRFTLYTPNTAAIIQRFLESKAVFDSKSPTGFSRWNAQASRLEPYEHKVSIGTEINAPIKDLSEENLAGLLGKYDRVTIAMADGNWKPEIPLPLSSSANRGRLITIDHQASYGSVLQLNGKRVKIATGFKKSYLSNGKQWRAVASAEQGIQRKPRLFGVPVVTLVGYYDPEEKSQTYIYLALHGACGFCYPDDSDKLNETDCHLRVQTSDGVLKFRLSSQRVSASNMNKFHINVPQASQPSQVAVVCGGRVIDEKTIPPVTEELVMTVNGIPVSRSAKK